MATPMLGTRIRERRKSLGVTQTDLARRMGVSASYLSLIEANKRGVAGPLLRAAAEALDLELDELDGAAERRLLATLNEIAQLPEFAALGVEAERTGDMLGRYPGWARAVAALARSERSAVEEASAQADRLAHDPILADTVHSMLTRIAAIRSAVEILTGYSDVPGEERDRFLRILEEEGRTLSDVGEALTAYFEAEGKSGRALTPVDEVEALFEAGDGRFAGLDAAAEGLAGGARSWAAARALAREQLAGEIEATVEGARMETAPARARAREKLTDYAAAAILAPMSAFAPRAAELRYDIDALAEAFGVDASIVFRRLTVLPEGPRFGYLRINAAGSMIERRGLPDLVAPRYAAACPLWALYRAQQSPEAVIRQRVVFPAGHRFVFVARAHCAVAQGFGRPRHYLTDMLAMNEASARLTVYAPDPAVPVEEVGPACRLCSRRDCAHRVDDPFGGYDAFESGLGGGFGRETNRRRPTVSAR